MLTRSLGVSALCVSLFLTGGCGSSDTGGTAGASGSTASAGTGGSAGGGAGAGGSTSAGTGGAGGGGGATATGVGGSGGSGTSGSAGGAGTGGSAGGAGTGGSAGGGAAGSAGSSSTGGTGGSGTGGMTGGCTVIANGATTITEMQVDTPPPSLAGGTVVEGTYFMVSRTVFTGMGGPTGPTANTHRTTIVIAGNAMHTVSSPNGSPPVYADATWTATGTTFTASVTCPVTVDSVSTYAATATTLSFLNGNNMDAYVKQLPPSPSRRRGDRQRQQTRGLDARRRELRRRGAPGVGDALGVARGSVTVSDEVPMGRAEDAPQRRRDRRSESEAGSRGLDCLRPDRETRRPSPPRDRVLACSSHGVRHSRNRAWGESVNGVRSPPGFRSRGRQGAARGGDGLELESDCTAPS
jgi:hypothetical protein